MSKDQIDESVRALYVDMWKKSHKSALFKYNSLRRIKAVPTPELRSSVMQGYMTGPL